LIWIPVFFVKSCNSCPNPGFRVEVSHSTSRNVTVTGSWEDRWQPAKVNSRNKMAAPAVLLNLVHLAGRVDVAKLLDGLVSFNLVAMFDKSSSFKSAKCTAKRVSLPRARRPETCYSTRDQTRFNALLRVRLSKQGKSRLPLRPACHFRRRFRTRHIRQCFPCAPLCPRPLGWPSRLGGRN